MTIAISTYDPNRTYHEQKKFDCGNATINKFVHGSLKSQVSRGLSVAYVLTDKSNQEKFVGFLTLVQHSINVSALSSLQLGSLPRHIPCTRLVMFGVDSAYSGKGYGKQLMREAFVATKQAARLVGSFGMYLDADPDPRTLAFYQKLGFVFLEGDKSPSPSPMFLPATSIP